MALYKYASYYYITQTQIVLHVFLHVLPAAAFVCRPRLHTFCNFTYGTTELKIDRTQKVVHSLLATKVFGL